MDRFLFHAEQLYPLVLGVLSGGFAYAYGPDVFALMIQKKWQYAAVYSSVFDVAALFTGFMFTFYTFVASTDRGFIGRSKKSRYYRAMIRFTLVALMLGTSLTVVTIPMMVVLPTPTAHSQEQALFACWAALAVWTLLAFLRAAHVFSVFAAHHE